METADAQAQGIKLSVRETLHEGGRGRDENSLGVAEMETQTGLTVDRPETPATRQAPQQRNTSAAAETYSEGRHFPEKSCHADSMPAPAASPS